MTETIAKFKTKTGNTIEPTLQDTTVVISEFQTASAAKNAPDVQFLWNGIYHMESVWLGYLDPPGGLIPAEEIKATNPTALRFQGKTYRMGWYSCRADVPVQQRDLRKGRPGRDQPPKTWDELLDALRQDQDRRLHADRARPERWAVGRVVHGPRPGPEPGFACRRHQPVHRRPGLARPALLGTLGQAGRAVEGRFPQRRYELDRPVSRHRPVRRRQGRHDRHRRPLAASQAKMLGSSEKIGGMVFPVFGKGKMAGKPIADCQGFGISSQSKNKEAAAEFIRFMHDP